MRGLPCILFRRYPIAITSSGSIFHANTIKFNNNKSNCYSTRKDVTKVDPVNTENKVSVDYVEVVKKNASTAGYSVVVAVFGAFSLYLLYFIFKELFSSNSPLGVFNRALERCQKDSRVLDALGEPIKVFGEGRRRRNHFSQAFYERNGTKYLRLKFYMQGLRRTGIVYVEAKDVSGTYELTNIQMQLDDVLNTVLAIDHT